MRVWLSPYYIVTDPVKIYVEPLTLLQIPSHFITDPSHFDIYPTKFRYVSNYVWTYIRTEFLTVPITFYNRSDHILLHIRAHYFKDPNTLCKQRIGMDLWNSGNGCFGAIWEQLCIPALFSIVEFCTLHGRVPMHEGLFLRINSDSEEARGSPW